jgi:hypothetical protein
MKIYKLLIPDKNTFYVCMMVSIYGLIIWSLHLSLSVIIIILLMDIVKNLLDIKDKMKI